MKNCASRHLEQNAVALRNIETQALGHLCFAARQRTKALLYRLDHFAHRQDGAKI
jgi:hypothetical protein